MKTVQEIYDWMDAFAPFDTAESWDNVGLLLGDPTKAVQRVMVCLDLTREAAAAAIQNDTDMVLTHHPIIFAPIRALTPREPWYPLAERGTAVLSMHTNLDAAPGGVSDALVEALGLEPEDAPDGCSRFLRFGRCAETDAPTFTAKTTSRLRAEGFSHTLNLSAGGGRFTRIAVCGGAGGDFWQDALRAGAGLLVTGEAKYHEIVDAHNAGLPILQLGHWLSEQFVLPRLCARLQALSPNLIPTLFLQDPSSVGGGETAAGSTRTAVGGLCPPLG